MTLSLKRAAVFVLGLSSLFVGGWAAFAPASFYRDFPLSGHAWVSAVGPYNEHLVRDVGALYLALLVLSAGAFLRPSDYLFRVTGLAWLVFGVEHLVFHAAHLEMFATADRVAMMAALGGTVLLAALLLPPTGGAWRFDARRPDQLANDRVPDSPAK